MTEDDRQGPCLSGPASALVAVLGSGAGLPGEASRGKL